MRRSNVFALSLLLLSCYAYAAPAELANITDPKLAQYYRSNSDTIDRLGARATNSAAPLNERLSALQQLQREFRYAAVPTAAKLIRDPLEPMALAAVSILADAVVMSDHPHATHAKGGKSLVELQHNLARDALQEALADTRRPVREIAAKTLASISDEDALAKINDGAARGLYSDVEAVNYLGLSNPDTSAKYIQPYLDASPLAQAAAVTYLGANPTFQATIRQRYLENVAAPEVAKIAAAKTLSRFDTAFVAYAPNLINAKSLPPEAYKELVNGYLARTAGRLDAMQLQGIDKALDEYIKIRPDHDLGGLKDRLKTQMLNKPLGK